MRKNQLDVTALGELLIDFIQNGTSEQGNPMFEANPGGAPCNVLAMLAKLGHSVSFIGKVGKDGFGTQLSEAITKAGIDGSGLVFDPEVHTTLSLVHKLPNGDRDFSFYRNPGADMNLKPEEVNLDLIRNAKIFHFGTLSMTDEPVLSATKLAIATAEESGCLRSFDPNLRLPLWHHEEDAKAAFDYGLHHCDILKISDNEIRWFTGKEDFDEGIELLQKTYHIPLITLSMGPDGSRAYKGSLMVEVPAFLQPNTIETTGAGDTFGACVLHGILREGMEALNEEKLRSILTFANAAASIVTTRKGALAVMPSEAEVRALIAAVH